MRRSDDVCGKSEEGTPTYLSEVMDREWGGMKKYEEGGRRYERKVRSYDEGVRWYEEGVRRYEEVLIDWLIDWGSVAEAVTIPYNELKISI